MKLYVMSGAANGTDSIDGMYYLIAETGECLASHFCSCKYFAKGDLYERRPERIEKFTKRFGGHRSVVSWRRWHDGSETYGS